MATDGPVRVVASPRDALGRDDATVTPTALHDAWCALDVPVAVFDVVDGGAFVWSAANPAQERALGVAFESVRGSEVSPDAGALESWLLVHAREAVARDARLTVDPEGADPHSDRWYARTFVPVHDARGVARRVVVTAADVTEQRRVEALLLQATRMDAIGRVAGNTAHEFNNLLVAISGYAGLALKSLPPEGKAREHMTEVINLTETASALTRKLLAFAKRQQGTAVAVRLDELAAGAERLLKRLLRADIALSIGRAPGLWLVKADPQQIEQVLIHLASHARESMPRGGSLRFEASNVSLTREEARALGLGPGEHVLLTARDTGVGMDAQSLQRVFDSAAPARPTRTETELGLATCYGIVRQHGGAITVSSALGAGTVFRIYLPRSVEKSTVSGMTLATAPLRGQEAVLLYNPGDPRAARALRMLGYTVLEAATLAETLRALDDHAPSPLDLALVAADASDAELPALLAALHGRFEGLLVLQVAPSPAGASPTAIARRVREALDAAKRA